MENVIQMPSKDDRIADEIRSHIEGMKNAECDWRDHAVALCECVAAAKARYPSTKAFGAWWDAQGFEMNHQTRAALVAMGQDMARAREVLAETERRSLLHVYNNEFRVTHVCKSPDEQHEPKESRDTKPRLRAHNAGRKDSEIAADLLTRRREGDDTPLNAPDVAGRYGVGHKTADTAINAALFAEQEIVKALAEHTDIDASDLPDEWKERYERVLRRDLKRQTEALQAGFHQAVKNENQQFIARLHADWKRKIEFAEKYGGGPLSAQQERFPFTRKQFKELLFFTHPDRQDESLRQRAAEIFSVVKEKEDSLVMPESPTGGPPFPSSPDDLLRSK